MSLESWTAHQTALGLHRYGAPLSASGLSVADLLRHAAAEAADQINYLRAASELAQGDRFVAADLFAAHADACMLGRLVCDLAGPAPEFVPPPQVPDADAVAKYGRWWWRGDEVVRVTNHGGELWWTPTGHLMMGVVLPSDDWGGPVQPRRRAVAP